MKHTKNDEPLNDGNAFLPDICSSEDEVLVRSYHATSQKPWLRKAHAEGYITVTTKRLVFRATGDSRQGGTLIHSETPIADISAVSCNKGRRLNLSYLLPATLISLISGFVAFEIFGRIPSGVLLLVAIALLVASASFRSSDVWRIVLVSMLVAVSPKLTFLKSDISEVFFLFVQGLVWFYGFTSLRAFASRESFSLSIQSRAGSVPSVQFGEIDKFHFASLLSKSGRTNVASGATEPGPDAQKLSEELGALVLDLQQLGTNALGKWQFDNAVKRGLLTNID